MTDITQSLEALRQVDPVRADYLARLLAVLAEVRESYAKSPGSKTMKKWAAQIVRAARETKIEKGA